MLSPQQLADLGAWLRGSGFDTGPQQLIHAARILHGQRRFTHYAQLSPYLAPIFCSDARQQQRFPAVFQAWLEVQGLHAAAEAVSAQAQAQQVQPGFELGQVVLRKNLAWWRRIWWALAGLIFVLLVAFRLLLEMPEVLNRQNPSKTPASAQTPLAVSPTFSPTSGTEPVKPDPLPKTSSAPAASSAVADAKSAPKAAPRVQIQSPFSPVQSLFLALGLSLLLAWYLFAIIRRHRFLKALPAETPSRQILRLALGRPFALSLEYVFKRIGPALRRPQPVRSGQLNVAASIDASLRRGGLPQAVLGGKQEPHYLVLVEANSHYDHVPELASACLEHWHRLGVELICYQFTEDTLHLPAWPLSGQVAGSAQTLGQLHQRYPQARLLIFADGANFIDRYSGGVHSMVQQLLRWPQPLMLTPNARHTWMSREWLLADAGVQLLALDELELAEAGPLLYGRGRFTALAVPEEARNFVGPCYVHHQDLWLDRVAPPAAKVAQLLQSLQADFSTASLNWLAACAAYPKIHWQITLALGRELASAKETEAAEEAEAAEGAQRELLQLLRLPWFRQGYMPSWLRQELLKRIPLGSQAEMQAALTALLRTLKQAKGEYAAPELQVHEAAPSRTWRQRWRRWFAPRLPEAAQDKVFLTAMGSGADLKGRWWCWLFKQGQTLAGPRNGVVAALLVLLVGGVAYRYPAVQEVEPVAGRRAAEMPIALKDIPQERLPLLAANQTPETQQEMASLGKKQPLPATGEPDPAITPEPQPSAVPALPFVVAEVMPGAPVSTTAQTIQPGQVLKDCDICPEMVLIPGGQFMMGGDEFNHEKPVHAVQVQAFLMGRVEVTQGQWRALMGDNPSYFKECGDDCPVETVSWNDAQAYLKKLSEKTGKLYRLPTEAEWEYAARADSSSRWHFGDDEVQLERFAWFAKNSGGKTHAVGAKEGNAFGLYDMHGNVLEWVEDCWHANYQGAPQNGSAWLQNCRGDARVLRGGSWYDTAINSRAADRNHGMPDIRNFDVGLRVARTPR